MKLYLASPHTITRFPNGAKELMKIYMAGAVSANLKPLWTGICKRSLQEHVITEKDKMQVFLAGGESRHWIHDEMKLFLAGQNGMHSIVSEQVEKSIEYHPYVLESFFYADEVTERPISHFGDFLLDSGAFTFMQGKGGSPDWDNYIERYSDFINRNNINKYFELDIDVVVGYDRVKEIRKKLEALTNRPCIPVWHLSRGLDEFKRMCDEYDYVAIGGIVSGEIKSKNYGALPALISEAHKRKAKIHGLGFTALDWLPKCHFDSVDSTAWTTGNRFGFCYYFDGKTMKKKDAPKGHRLADSRKVALINYTEWIKFQKYAETNL